MTVGAPGGEQVLVGRGGFMETGGSTIAAQDLQQTEGQHGVAVLGSFALFDADKHALGVDRGDLEGHRFAHPESGAVAGHQGGAVFETGNVVEELHDLLLAQHDRQLAGTLDAGKILVRPGRFQGGQIQKLHRRNILIDGFS